MTPCQCIKGAVGLAKAAAQAVGVPVDQAGPATVAARRDACRGCEHASRDPARLDRPTKGLTALSVCGACGCLLVAKTMLASESCPEGRWAAAPSP